MTRTPGSSSGGKGEPGGRAEPQSAYVREAKETVVEDMVRIFVNDVRVDGIFTDFPDRALKALSQPQ